MRELVQRGRRVQNLSSYASIPFQDHPKKNPRDIITGTVNPQFLPNERESLRRGFLSIVSRIIIKT